MKPFDYFDELGHCACLFLDELVELDSNSMRIRVAEGIRAGVSVPVELAGNSIGEGFPVQRTAKSAIYELTWHSYVLYQVTNECYGKREPSQDGISNVSSAALDSSSLLEFVSRSTNASNEYPGKLTHYRLICSDHVIDVVSTHPPHCVRIGPELKVN